MRALCVLHDHVSAGGHLVARLGERGWQVDELLVVPAERYTDPDVSVEFPAPRHDTAHTHGSGDTLAAAITASLARGADLPCAVADGKRFITEAVRGSFALGRGLGPVGHFWRVAPWP